MGDDLISQIEDGIATLIMNRPESANSLNISLMVGLKETLNRFEMDDSINVIILTGSGEKAFCSGIDIKEREKMTEEEVLRSRSLHVFPLFKSFEEMTKPLIAAVNGVALGGGAELALACDVRIASENASFGLIEIRWGIIPPGGSCQRLPRLIGTGMAKELILTGRVIDAREAERIGIYNRVVTSKNLLEEAKRLAQEINQNSPIAVRQAKKTMDIGANIHMALSFDREASKECYFLRKDEVRGLKGKR
jgi:enoyl-CoA hydratase/carnithine racemase